MLFWNNFDVIVYIYDGSIIPISNTFLTNLNKNIRYQHNSKSFTERIKLASNIVNTKYVILLSDDEFFIPSALVTCIEELENNSDLISCGGRCLGFNPIQKTIQWQMKYTAQRGYKIINDNPLERINEHMRNYTPSIIYSITRTEFWKKTVTSITDFKYPDPGTTELQLELVFSFFGKSKILPIIMWLRSNENPPHDTRKEINFHNWWVDEQYIVLKHKLIDELTFILNDKNSIISNVDLKVGIERAFNFYIEWQKNNGTYVDKRNYIIKFLGKTVFKSLKKLYVITYIKSKIDLKILIIKLKKENVFLNISEFNIIQNLILNFNKNKY
jgi:glycosyltransferase domain-containing protein